MAYIALILGMAAAIGTVVLATITYLQMKSQLDPVLRPVRKDLKGKEPFIQNTKQSETQFGIEMKNWGQGRILMESIKMHLASNDKDKEDEMVAAGKAVGAFGDSKPLGIIEAQQGVMKIVKTLWVMIAEWETHTHARETFWIVFEEIPPSKFEELQKAGKNKINFTAFYVNPDNGHRYRLRVKMWYRDEDAEWQTQSEKTKPVG